MFSNTDRDGVSKSNDSGKSSIIAALVGLLKISSGQIIIDSMDTQLIPKDLLRSRLITVPQTFCVLPGTVRSNVDPFGSTADDTRITSVLVEFELWQLIQDHGGLDADCAQIPFSAGQYQLLGLIRAYFRTGPILVLDEIDSILDQDTEEKIQRFLRERLFDRTVVAVTHKIENILDFDEVVVLADGRIVERGNPRTLWSDEGSLLRSMY